MQSTHHQSDATSAGPIRSIRTGPKELEALIARLLQRSTSGQAPSEHNGAQPQAFNLPNIAIDIVHPSGSSSRVLVDAYQLSSAGLSVVHGSYVHVGTRVVARLMTVDNAWIDANGRIVRCDYVSGLVHDIGLVFDDPIDISDVIPGAGGQLRMLFVDSSEMLPKLAAVYLKEIRAAVTGVSSCDAALEAVRGRDWDAIFIDVNMPDGDARSLVASWRSSGTNAFLVGMFDSGESRDDLDEMKSGFDATLDKPLNREALLAMAANAKREPMISSFAADTTMRELLLDYAGRLPKEMDAILAAMKEYDSKAVGVILRRTRADAAAFGYEPLSKAAVEVEDLMKANKPLEDLASALMVLVRLSRTVAV